MSENYLRGLLASAPNNALALRLGLLSPLTTQGGAMTANPNMMMNALRRRNAALDPAGFPIDLGRPILNNPDGSIATEESMTEQIGNRYYNFPSIWRGQRMPPENAFNLFQQSLSAGGQYPNFPTLEEAENAARQRSQLIGILRGAK